MGERTEVYDREKLYEEVWKEPVLVVAKRYGVSDVALAKACRKLAVPLPPRGYWARIQAGQVPKRPPLPPLESLKVTKSTHLAAERSPAMGTKVTEEKGGKSSTNSNSKIHKNTESHSQTEPEKADKRVTRKRPKEFPEHLYCTIDGWQRTFRFGVNRFGPIKGLQEEVEPYDEWDHLQVFATIRYHDKPIKGRKRTGQHVELWVFPTHVPRKDWRDDPEAIGRVWTQQGKLFGTLRIPADTFYSLFPCLASNHFEELELRLLRMHYRQGDIDGIEFSPKETPMEDLL
ncbi:MAG: hypothetical protein FJ115_14295 [Deltaproteobacteria bacterium]|nr:hypothetical protein [Deltaproteobacteria bacterium]